MFKRFIASFVCLTFIFSNFQYAHAQDFSINQLPVPGTMVGVSAPFAPLTLKGLIVNPQKPLEFQFIIDTGRGPQATAAVKDQANQLVKYFLVGLTIPEGDLWVNLSPYEKDRMVPQALGQTDLGRDLLAQDYILKQLTASLIYPERDLGKEFWSRVYAKAQVQFGTTNVPVNTFNKVWILPDQAQVFENVNAAYVTQSTLKVMLDEDYLALGKNNSPRPNPPHQGEGNDTHTFASQIVRQIVLPEIEKEVNTGKNFGPLRQIYQALILAKWYKETIQNGLLDAVYTNKKKVAGVNLEDPAVKEQIYNRYLQAYKKGAFNYIKESPTPDGQVVPRKYFSGGTQMRIPFLSRTHDEAMLSKRKIGTLLALTISLTVLMPSGAAYANYQKHVPTSNHQHLSQKQGEKIVNELVQDIKHDNPYTNGLLFVGNVKKTDKGYFLLKSTDVMIDTPKTKGILYISPDVVAEVGKNYMGPRVNSFVTLANFPSHIEYRKMMVKLTTLSNPPAVRIAAAVALRRMPGSSLIPDLINMLKDPNPDVRLAGVIALGSNAFEVEIGAFQENGRKLPSKILLPYSNNQVFSALESYLKLGVRNDDMPFILETLVNLRPALSKSKVAHDLIRTVPVVTSPDKDMEGFLRQSYYRLKTGLADNAMASNRPILRKFVTGALAAVLLAGTTAEPVLAQSNALTISSTAPISGYSVDKQKGEEITSLASDQQWQARGEEVIDQLVKDIGDSLKNLNWRIDAIVVDANWKYPLLKSTDVYIKRSDGSIAIFKPGPGALREEGKSYCGANTDPFITLANFPPLPEFRNKLVRLLSSPIPAVRAAAAISLRGMPDRTLIPHLVKLLGDSNPDVRLAAVIALGSTESDIKRTSSEKDPQKLFLGLLNPYDNETVFFALKKYIKGGVRNKDVPIILETLINLQINSHEDGFFQIVPKVDSHDKNMEKYLQKSYLLLKSNILSNKQSTFEELGEAAGRGDLMKVKFYIAHGVNINGKDQFGWTPLMYASKYNNEDVVKFLLNHGADVNLKNHDANTALIEASFQGNRNIVELLLDKGAKINAKDKNGYTPLISACISSADNVVELLIDGGANINAKDTRGWTALRWVRNQLNVFHGPNIDAKNNRILTILLSHGAKDNAMFSPSSILRKLVNGLFVSLLLVGIITKPGLAQSNSFPQASSNSKTQASKNSDPAYVKAQIDQFMAKAKGSLDKILDSQSFKHMKDVKGVLELQEYMVKSGYNFDNFLGTTPRADELIKMGKSAVPVLRTYLSNPDRSIRMLSTGALAFISDKSAVNDLKKLASSDPEWIVRAFSVYGVISSTKSEESVPYGLDILRGKDPFIVKVFAINAMNSYGGGVATDAFLKELKGSSDDMWLSAVFGLGLSAGIEFRAGEFNETMKVASLIEALKQSGIDIPVADTPIDSLNELLTDQNLFKVMKVRPAETLPPIMGQLEQGRQLDPSDIIRLNRILIEANYPLQTPKNKTLSLLLGSLESSNSRVRAGAIVTLNESNNEDILLRRENNSDQDFNALNIMLNSKNEDVRALCLVAIVKYSPKSKAKGVLKKTLNDPSQKLRSVAKQLLKDIDEPDNAMLMETALKQTQDTAMNATVRLKKGGDVARKVYEQTYTVLEELYARHDFDKVARFLLLLASRKLVFPEGEKDRLQSRNVLLLQLEGEGFVNEIMSILKDSGAAVFEGEPTLAGVRSIEVSEDVVKVLRAGLYSMNRSDNYGLQDPRDLTVPDGAMIGNNTGGIDLNQINVLHNGKTVNVQFDPAQLYELMQGGFEGFSPVIINITPIQSPLPLLGIGTVNEGGLAKV
ncbi:MAG: HEAT repeat domain-containing protein [Candidatus Omnitrophica bacterium]|nr:HEAT repeat domain-containing protein [Candidatus Omnitrophota bacterium]